MTKQKRQIGFGDWKCPPKLKGYISDILKTGRLTYGKYCRRLEEEFGKINGTKYNVFCSSGTAALYTAIGVLKNLHPEMLEKRKYIVIPSTTFISDLNVVLSNGFEPIFVDVGANYNISYTELENTLKTYGNKVFAVMPSSLMGRPVDGLRIRELIDLYAKGAFFILDSCENISSKYAGQYPEEFADFTAWSGYISHLWIAGAAGGMIGTNNEKYAIHARSFINHGRNAIYTDIDADNNVDAATLRDITAKRFSFIQVGQNFRLGEMEAACGLSMLEDDFQAHLQKRKKNAEYLIGELGKFELILPKFTDKEECRHMMLPIRVARGDKWDLVHHLEESGVETRDILPLFGHATTNPYFGNSIEFRTSHPVSWEIYEKGFYIGCHSYLEREDLEYMVQAFAEFFKK